MTLYTHTQQRHTHTTQQRHNNDTDTTQQRHNNDTVHSVDYRADMETVLTNLTQAEVLFLYGSCPQVSRITTNNNFIIVKVKTVHLKNDFET